MPQHPHEFDPGKVDRMLVESKAVIANFTIRKRADEDGIVTELLKAEPDDPLILLLEQSNLRLTNAEPDAKLLEIIFQMTPKA